MIHPAALGAARSTRVARTVFSLGGLRELMSHHLPGGKNARPDPRTSDVWDEEDKKDLDALIKQVERVNYRRVESKDAKRRARHRPGRDGAEHRLYPGRNSARGISAGRLYPVEP